MSEPAESPEPWEQGTAGLAGALDEGELKVTGRLLQASNATFLCEISASGREPLHCVYKPVAGERPLWDFPDGTLAEREVAAYRVSAAAGFDVVPPTVLIDGPLGVGSLQAWIDVDEDATDALVGLVRPKRVPKNMFAIVQGLDEHERPVVVVHADDPRLRRMALLDVLINNADRKGGHILAADGRVWGVDHGVSLNAEPKLRTLLWGWAGEELDPEEIGLIRRTAALARDAVDDLITAEETEALEIRCADLIAEGTFPLPFGGWPSIPWPPF